MRIALDFDGVITKHPHLFLMLATALKQSGDEVVILTAAAGELAPELRPAEVLKRANRLGFRDFRIICCESAEKPERCKQEGINLLIDDTPYKLGKETLQLMPL